MRCVVLFDAYVSSQQRTQAVGDVRSTTVRPPPPSWRRLARRLLNPDRGRIAGAIAVGTTADILQAWEP
ncbi:MAG TPA: hypothetical protein VJY65_09370 [Chloroflexota bacterium]|nr:hypothetical protein [Chloroflexota bacterium]